MMDLGSTNGTFINGDRLEAEQYYELLEKVGAGCGSCSPALPTRLRACLPAAAGELQLLASCSCAVVGAAPASSFPTAPPHHHHTPLPP